MSPKTDKAQTATQRNARHKWYELSANYLNDAGIERRAVLEELSTRGIDLPWTKENFKEMWRGIQVKMLEKHSTEELDTIEPNEIYRAISVYFSQEYGVTLPEWPSRFTE